MGVEEKPVKVYVTDLNSGEVHYAQFNPEQLKRRAEAKYVRKSVLGQSHEPLQYTGTKNQTFPLDLWYDALDQTRRTPNPFGEGDQSTAIGIAREARKFFESLVYPEGVEIDGALAEPTDVLVVWPRNLSLVCKLLSVEFDDRRFAPTGEPIQFMIKTQWEEVRRTRLTNIDVRAIGAQRGRGN